MSKLFGCVTAASLKTVSLLKNRELLVVAPTSVCQASRKVKEINNGLR
jgi:hypothetical protein